MSNTVNVQVNDLVEFRYNGGSHPGTVRFVKVNNVTKTGFNGHDVYADKPANSFRNFDQSKVVGLKVVHRPVAPQNVIRSGENGSVVIERKNGNTLTILVNKGNLEVSSHKGGTHNTLDKNVVVGLPLANDTLFDGVVNAIKEFVG